MKLIINKKNNRYAEEFNTAKIERAIQLSANRLNKVVSEELMRNIILSVTKRVDKYLSSIDLKCDEVNISVDLIHNFVQESLHDLDKELFEQYTQYVDYKRRFNKSFGNILSSSKKIIYSGDKENANKNSSINSTQKELLSGLISRELMTEYELPLEVARAHKNSYLYVHDLTDRLIGSLNCCLFDAATVMKGGFELNGVKIKEPNSIEVAGNVICDIIMVASSQQYGGFTIPEIDSTLAPYVRKSIKKETEYYLNLGIEGEQLRNLVVSTVERKLKQTMQSLEHKINCVNNALGQTPFVTVSFGLDTSSEGRMVTKAILETRLEKMGENKITAIFPKLVFLHREDINGKLGTPNYDLKQLGIKCSMENLYPDWLSLDAGYLGEVFDRCGKAISPMGCRAFLSPWENENGEETYIGRFNIGAVTLNLPRYAIDSNGDKEVFFSLIDKYFELALQTHLYTYEKMSKKKASSNPLFFVEGGCAVKLNPSDNITKALECATASFGYIGLTEACYLLSGKALHENVALGEEILSYIRNKIDKAKEEHNRLFAMYGTPSEGLCDKFLKADLEKYGVIKGVTDKEWYMNSHHVDVRAKVTALEKMEIEDKLYKYPTGGRIMYTEWPHTDNAEAIESVINRGMKKGMYIGINFENSTCNDCKAKGDFKEGTCSKCGSHNITTIDRVCGYLGIYQANGDTRYNEGKEKEVLNRVKHYNCLTDI